MAILPDFSAAQFEPGAPVDNPYFPLPPGTIYSHGGSKVDSETGETDVERNNMFVTSETKTIEGIETIVVRDTAYNNGVLVEDTLDWYAQDTEGNVWYFGETVQNYIYDDQGTYVETNNDGSWEAGVDGAVPGWIMKAAPPGFGTAYFQEFAEGIAEDEAILASVNQDVSIGFGDFENVIKTIDTSALEPDVGGFKYFAPGIGEILVEEAPNEQGIPEISVELTGIREVGEETDGGDDGDVEYALSDLVEGQQLPGIQNTDGPDADDFEGDGSAFLINFLSSEGGLNNSIGAYTFDVETGEFGEGRILFTETSTLEPGMSVAVTVEEGEALGIFLVPDGGELGLDLSQFEDGGLTFINMLTGDPATIEDELAPLIADANGMALPIQAFHALGNDDGFNFLNPAAGVYAVELDTEATANFEGSETSVIGFEETLITNPDFDGDYNDVVLGISEVSSAGADAMLIA
ncbi:MAG: hypothetical protein H6905_05325 [Hyphomicrobiales bacterium]|nr:hypothetical protein [Hyphomicrobiales bacterium]